MLVPYQRDEIAKALLYTDMLLVFPGVVVTMPGPRNDALTQSPDLISHLFEQGMIEVFFFVISFISWVSKSILTFYWHDTFHPPTMYIIIRNINFYWTPIAIVLSSTIFCVTFEFYLFLQLRSLSQITM